MNKPYTHSTPYPTAPPAAAAPPDVQLTGPGSAQSTLRVITVAPGLYDCHLHTAAPAPVQLRWTYPATGVKGVWSTGALHEKRLRADWEAADCEARISVDAPVLCLFGHHDENILTVAVSDAVNTATLRAPVREEDNLLHCVVELFDELPEATDDYNVTVRIDLRQAYFGAALDAVRAWWETAGGYAPMPVPEAARDALYSTWYAYHQSVSSAALLAECRLARELGMRTIIVDDGWQTLDSNRGYDYTGDWTAERMTDLGDFVDQVHALGMKAMIWYSVPFCGKKSKAYQRFKGKFLTENHRWAPVFDPRYPEVRAYLIEKYVTALELWQLDGFKLDFIDDFRTYPETPVGLGDGRDYASVNRAVERLLADIRQTLEAIRPNLLIEFRQRYVGPVIRRYGNMFRAFDCPADPVTNRMRTTDLRLICGTTAVHSDMLTWHPDSPVEVAALQLNNVLFSVPQLSIQLPGAPPAYREMIGFYLQFYNTHRAVLLDGDFTATGPLENYPQLRAERGDTCIVGYYAERPATVPAESRAFHLINGTLLERVVLRSDRVRRGTLQVWDCRGRAVPTASGSLAAGLTEVPVPPGGILELRFAESETVD